MCIFCDIVAGNIPSNKLYEDDQVIVFFDIAPTSYGHCLVVPKEHCSSFLDCPSDLRDHVFQVAQTVANQLKEKLSCDGINILSNVGEAAGQTVSHFHVHLIPRYEKGQDALSIEFGKIEDVDFQALIQKVKN